MKYYIVVGEASGDLHASCLIKSLKAKDHDAIFRFFGGDLMTIAAGKGGERVRHYKDLAYMGFIPVILHLRTILGNMSKCKRDIAMWKPDVVILVDYPGFNLNIAKFVKANTSVPVFYYISPKIWAWKEYRIKSIKRDVSEMFSILPFEVDFYEKKHGYPIHYVGNPTADEVEEFKAKTDGEPSLKSASAKGIIALLAGSRLQEIEDNLPIMIEATHEYSGEYDIVVAGAPSVSKDYYDRYIENTGVRIVYDDTYNLLNQATVALVTSGTATLETAMFGVPQVVCYGMKMPHLMGFLKRTVLKVKYISLVNLIADSEVVPELVADAFTVASLRNELTSILPGGSKRDLMLEGYKDVRKRIKVGAHPSDVAASLMIDILRKNIK